MVVLAASVLSKSGKALVSRQYVDMSRIRIEGLLAAFPKLVGSGGKQHTYVETESVRYVYQPMEGLYVVLVTNKQSNILEDLETLRLVSKLVPEFCLHLSPSGLLEEEAVSLGAFDLIFAFDEVISLGHKENTTVLQVKQNCDMESHEEKLHKMIIQSKINDTKDIMKQKAIEIDKVKLESRKNVTSAHLPAAYSSMDRPPVDVRPRADPTASFGASSMARPEAPKSGAASARGPSKGMQLGKAKKTNEFLQSLKNEGEVVEVEAAAPKPGSSGAAAGPGAPARPSDPTTLDIEERLSVQLNKEGGLEGLEVQGTMSLVVHSDEEAFIRVAIASGPNRGFQFKTHPNIDKAAYSSSNVLGLKDPSRPFPTGSELGILKWRMASKDEGLVPLTINCWPSLSGGQSYVNIEYESTSAFDLHNVAITIPLPHNAPPTVNQVDGDWKFDSKRGVLLWTIELIDETNSSGSMEFVVPAADSNSFYPVDISFAATKTFCDIVVEGVTHTLRDGAPVRFTSKRQLVTTDYSVS